MEVESGKRKDRPELAKATSHAKRTKATLVVAKLDRLSRNAGFLFALRDSGLPLIFCDMPGANELTVGIMAVVADAEGKMISQRTKDALQAAKRRGLKLGSARSDHWKGREDRRQAGAIAGGQAAGEAHRRAADASYGDLIPTLKDLRAKGQSLQNIADELNAQGHTTRRGKPWSAMQVSRVLKRAA
jgi:DNA invertase Pin-like site-specific DNA recombinase